MEDDDSDNDDVDDDDDDDNDDDGDDGDSGNILNQQQIWRSSPEKGVHSGQFLAKMCKQY